MTKAELVKAIAAQTGVEAVTVAKNTSITIPAHNIPAFKPSKEFMDKVK